MINILTAPNSYSMKIKARNSYNNKTFETYINILLDYCPVCHRYGTLNIVSGSSGECNYMPKEDKIQIIYRCVGNLCLSLILAEYSNKKYPLGTVKSADSPRYILKNFYPYTIKETEFSEEIVKLSPDFCEIYNQSVYAGKTSLDKIEGVGLRKAIEFLINDYVIYLYPEEKENIKKKWLGNVIKDHLGDHKIKPLIEASTWLGNDQVHYVKKHEDYNVEDMKKMIDIIVGAFTEDIRIAEYKKIKKK